jgi:5-methylcytosine-specific restriction endonuclease McrA
MCLKRTELKRTKIARKRKKTQAKKDRAKQRALEKLEKRLHYKSVCERVNERDGGCCRECGSPNNVERHHIIFRSQSGKDDIENLVSLCSWCHKYSQNSPHQNRGGRLKWERWAERRYPSYWKKIREGQKIHEKLQRV